MLQIVTIKVSGLLIKKDFFMKKLLLTAIFVLFLSVRAEAAMVIIDYQGDTLVTSNNIERTLIVNSDDGTNYYIAVRPLQETVTKEDGSVSIPLEYLFINNTREDVYLRYNEYSNIFWDANMGGTAKVMTAKIKNYGIVPAGVYNIPFEIQATDIETKEIACMSMFNLQFVVPPTQQLNAYSEMPRISVTASDVFSKNRKIASETSPMIYIRSNTDWILSLDTTDFGDMAGNYYVRTVSASGGVTNRLQERALITPGREIILARGKAPANNEFVSVEFSVENPDGKPIPAGNYQNRVKYILREGEV